MASQNVTDPMLGVRGLDLLANGASAAEVAAVASRSDHASYRQVLIVDATGATAVHSGENALGVWSEAKAVDVASGGNLLADPGVPQAIVDGFVSADGHLGDRLIAAMRAGLAAGGEAGPVRSAGMKIVDKAPWPIADLRCDWTDACPIEAIETAWAVYKPQIDAYLQRAIDPSAAPSYGVPGDEGPATSDR